MKNELMQLLRTTPWALRPDVLRSMVATVAAASDGAPPPQLKPARTAAEPATTRPRRIAVLPLEGIINYRETMMMYWFGGTALDKWRARLAELADDASVDGIILQVDSPGGSVYGTQEAADDVFALRGRKPVVALVNVEANSAAYYIASQAARMVITPSGAAGSIGVWCMHVDQSGWMAQLGLKTTIISAGKYKVEGNPWEPLDDDAKAAIQEDVDTSFELFLAAAGRGRGVDVETVRSNYGEGRVLDAREALAAGMVDRIGQMPEAVEEVMALGGWSGERAASRAAGVHSAPQREWLANQETLRRR